MNQEITNLLKAYEKALNTSDPIFMAQNAVAFIGRGAVQSSYQHIFEARKLNVVFSIHEIVEMATWRIAAPLRPDNRRSGKITRTRWRR